VTPKCSHWWEGAEILKIEICRVSLKVGHFVVACKMILKDRKTIRSEYILFLVVMLLLVLSVILGSRPDAGTLGV
jgi:predicted nucleic acid-binding Zn ribbon protein